MDAATDAVELEETVEVEQVGPAGNDMVAVGCHISVSVRVEGEMKTGPKAT